MSFFINDAIAEQATAAAAQGQGSGTSTLIFLVATFALFYFIMIRPQTKRAKEHRRMVDNIATGDEVITNGGILGKITKVEESFITLEVAEGFTMKIQKGAVSTSVPKGTIQSS